MAVDDQVFLDIPEKKVTVSTVSAKNLGVGRDECT